MSAEGPKTAARRPSRFPGEPAEPGPAPTPHVCARCQGCCHLKPGQEELVVPLSPAEVGRLMERGPWALSEGLVADSTNSEAFRAEMQRLFADWAEAVERTFPAEGRHFHMAVTAEGVCAALGPQGCRLPTHLKPLVCRLYPFWVVRGQLQVFANQDCLALKESRTFAQAYSSLGISQPQVERLHRQLLREWGLDQD